MPYVELIQREAEAVFGNKTKTETWLNKPQAGLGDSTPLELAHNKTGYELVKAELERISHGFAC